MSGKPFGGRHSPGDRPPQAEGGDEATADAPDRHGAEARPGGRAEFRPETPATRPGAASAGQRFRGRRAAAVDVRGLFLFALPTPLLFAALADIGGGAVAGAAADLVAYALLMAGAWLLREGQRAEAAYHARAVARRPAVPRKILAACAAGLGVGLATLAGWGQGPVTAAGMGALACLAHLMAFGIDPLGHKGIDVLEGEAGRVAEALDRADVRLAEITRLARTIRDREIEARVDRLMSAVRGLLTQLERDPRDLPRARRYLSVYLAGAEEATRKYAESHEALADPRLRADYLELIGDLESSFQRGRRMLLEDDRTDLEIEIEVLRDRLAQEIR